jgi:hypothetical protein
MATETIVKKSVLKMALSGLSVPNFIIRCSAINQAVSQNNDVFTSPTPTMEVLKASIVTLNERQMAVENAGGTDNTILRNQAQTIVFDHMRTLANYVSGVANGSAQIIFLSGFDIASSKGSVGLLPPPNKVKVICDGLNIGELQATWSGVNGSTGFMIELSLVTDSGLQLIASVKPKRLKHTFTGLISGALYSIKVATLSSAGQGSWSNPVLHRPQ